MRLQSYLQEEYHSRHGKVEVFINPTKKEFNEIGKSSIRFIADLKKKELYIWDAFRILHSSMWARLTTRLLKTDVIDGNVIAGLLERIGGKWELTEYDGGEYAIAYINELPVRQIKDYVKKTKWLDIYFNFTEPFKDSMKEIGKWPGKE